MTEREKKIRDKPWVWAAHNGLCFIFVDEPDVPYFSQTCVNMVSVSDYDEVRQVVREHNESVNAL